MEFGTGEIDVRGGNGADNVGAADVGGWDTGDATSGEPGQYPNSTSGDSDPTRRVEAALAGVTADVGSERTQTGKGQQTQGERDETETGKRAVSAANRDGQEEEYVERHDTSDETKTFGNLHGAVQIISGQNPGMIVPSDAGLMVGIDNLLDGPESDSVLRGVCD
jgi:hypothetical protein